MDDALSSPGWSECRGGRRRVAAVVAALLVAGCSGLDSEADATPDYGADYGEMVFRDAPTNAEFDVPVRSLTFVTTDGRAVTLEGLAAGRPVVLVITRGRTQPICPVCTTQTARLIRAYPQFAKLGAEVIVVYPKDDPMSDGSFGAFLDVVAQRLDEQTIDVPFPIVFDPGLAVVRRLNIEQSLAKPTTLIVDEGGNIRYAYVGETYTERPKIETLLNRVREIVGVQPSDGSAPSHAAAGPRTPEESPTTPADGDATASGDGP